MKRRRFFKRRRKNKINNRVLQYIVLLHFIFFIFFFWYVLHLRNWEIPEYFSDGIAKTKIEEYARIAGDWIVHSQLQGGRHAGTTYSLLYLYQYTNDRKYLKGGIKGIKFILKHTKRRSKFYYVQYNLQAKLGGTALSLLCLLKYRELTGRKNYDTYIKKMGKFILEMQDQETGKFRSYYYFFGNYNYNKDSTLYPGEAKLALIRLYLHYKKDEKYLKGLELGTPAWAIGAFSEAYVETKIEKYGDFALLLADKELSHQVKIDRMVSDHNVKGGFYAFPTVLSSSSLEAIGDAYKVASLRNDELRIKKYKNSIMMGIKFILKLQYRKEEIKNFPNGRRAFGAFHKSFPSSIVGSKPDKSSDLRIDYTQHALSALLRGLYIFDEEELKVFDPVSIQISEKQETRQGEHLEES